jgi:hypothetical protein
VLIVEGDPHGHRLFYVKLLIEQASQDGVMAAFVTTVRCRESSEFDATLSPLLKMGMFELVVRDDLGLESITALSRATGSGRTVLLDGDSYIRALAKARRWRGLGEVSVLIMREHAQPGGSRLSTFVREHVKRGLMRRLAEMSDVRLCVLRSPFDQRSSDFRVAVDPVVIVAGDADRAAVQEAWNLDRSTYWFAVLGAVTARKNLPLVAEALSAISEMRIGLLVAGNVEPGERRRATTALSKIREGGGKVRVIDRLLEDVELDAAIGAVDCLVLAHSNEGPSGLLGKAAASGTRVVAAGAMSLRRDAEAISSLCSWTTLEAEALSHELQRVVSLQRPAPTSAGSVSGFARAMI